MASSGTGKPLNVCPTNVKEALDWLEAFGPGASQCSQIITQKKIIGDNSGLDGNKAKGLCKRAKEFLEAIKKNGGSYKSAYDLGSWSTMCQSSGGKCCADNPACSGCTAGQCDGCCAKCPKQICARIFCMIVPVLRNVLMYMLGRCNTKNGKNGVWAEQTLNGTGSNGSSGTDLKNFMVACGFKENELNGTTKGGDLTMDDSGNILGLLVIPLGQMKNAINKALEENHNPTQHFLNGASPASNKKPSSLTDLLLWLQFLPYCSNYSDVISKVKAEINDSNGNGDLFVNDLPMAISHLPMLFLQIEGKGERGNTSPVHGSSLFLKIAELSKCQYIFDQKYYEEGTVVKMLLCVFPVIHWGLKALKDRCKNGSCGSTLKQCTETNKLLTYLGWNGTEGKPSVSGNMNCKTFRDYLSTNFLGNSSALAEMKKILEGVWKADNAPTGSSASSGSYLPKTIYEMLIWLMGLPVSEKFKDLKTQIKGLNGGSGGSNGVNVTDVMQHFTEILFQVPHLFLALNGDLSGMLNGLFQCHGISEPSKAYQYGSSGSECLKIFSAIVAILFPVIRYLQQRCKGNNSVFKNGESWSTKETNADGLKTYLNFAGFQPISSSGMNGQQFHSGVLQPIFGDLTGQNGGAEKLKKLYDCAQKGIQQTSSSTTGSHTPSTIRQMMLWLIGLPVTKEYGNNGSGLIQTVTTKAQQINDLKNKITNGHTSFQHQFQHSIVGMMTVINQIEGGLKSVVEFLKEGFKDGSKFKYDGFNGDESLLKVFSSYVTSVHVQLRFLKVMCGRQKDQGGWQECTYGKDSCTCNTTLKISCLKLFLQNGNNGASGSGDNKFKLMNGSSEHLKMGFKAYTPNQSGITGDNIHIHLEHMLDPIPKTPSSGTVEFKKPLSLLTQYCVAIGKMDPSSLGDHFDVFRELAGDMWSKMENVVKTEIKGITTSDSNGQGASEKLKAALQAVWPGSHTEHNDDSADLRSLTGCQGNNCTPFIATLSHGLYKYCDPSKLQSPAQKINWLYMKMSALYGKLTTLKESMEKACQCCPEGNPKPGSPCPGITKCPNCLPLMYKMGLVFGDPVTISTNKCSELMEKMKKVLDATSKLCVVFTSIEPGRFKPYLLFSSHVVHGKKDQLTGGDDLKTYTHALGEEYQKYLTKVKGEDNTKAQTNKGQRDGALKCTCPSQSHSYTPPKPVSGTATVVTLTLYFQGTNIQTTIQLVVPHHYPFYNPLVRRYPRNLKSIVDWLLRIGQTRLGQDGSGASKDGALKEMRDNLWPKIQECLNVQDDNSKQAFQLLVKNVMSLMGLENQGKTEVEKEVKKEYDKAQKNIQKKLNGGSEGFEKTFTSILTFKPNKYIDKVIEDFGKRVCNVTTNGVPKERSFECIAKSVSTCMKDSLKEIQKLATQNKSEMKDKYGVSITDLSGTITEVQQLKSISDLNKLCEGFKTFHDAYDKVTGAFNGHLTTAQSGAGKTQWDQITKCVEAFNKLGECVTELGEISSYDTATQMPTASQKLQALSTKLEKVIDKLNGDEIKALTEKVDEFIDALDDVLKKQGETTLATALQINTGGKNTQFDTFLRTYVSNVIQEMKNNTNNTVYDLHLRVRNDLLQLSECLKVMCEVCGTGMTEFAAQLKECVEKGKEHLDEIKEVKDKLEKLKNDLEEINGGTKEKYEKEMKPKLTESMKTIHSLLKDPYIYQTQPIVSTSITENDTSTMTTYLKSLPDLIRDRYVLQKWTDDSAYFCGVQRFENGIVKGSDINGITTVLQDLLRDTFHDQTTYCVTIHEFQVRALIYNFCHKEAMEQTGSGVMLLYHINYHINGAQGTPQSQASLQWTNIKDKKEKLSPLLTKLSDNAYLRYFATHLRDSVGYHTLSNTLGALEKVKEKLKESNGSSQPDKWNEFKDLLQKTAIDELYNRLSSLLDKLHREYIFEYPPFDWQKSCQKLMRKQDEAEKAAQTGRQRRSTDAQAAPSPKATTPNTCEMCVPSMAHIFVGFVPQMYRLFKMLREIAQKEKQSKSDTLLNADNVQDILTKTLTVAGFFECEGWRLKLGSDMTKDVEVFPFDLEHSKTGDDLCKFLDDIITDKEPGALVAQGEASTTDSLKPLDKLFQAVMQHFRKKRDELRKKREKALEDEFNKKHKDSGLTFQAPPAPLPSTVRQVLFWLHEMDTNKAFYDGMSQHINTLCQQSSIRISHDNILHVLNLSITQCLEVLSTVEDPGRQNAQYYYELYTEEHYYAYPDANIPLFFYTFVEKLMGAFLELNFVCVQCDFGALEGGWKDCRFYGEDTVPSRYKRGVKCECIPSFVEYTCSKPLSAFLFSDQKNQLRIPGDVSQRLPYMSKGTMPCGFQLKNKAITDAATQGDAQSAPTPTPTSMTGSVLVEPLQKLVGGHVKGRLKDTSTRNDDNNTLSTVIYLRDLLRYTLCLAVRPPWSMSENMAFFYRVTESWKKQGGVSVAHHNAKLLGAIHAEIALFPGTFDGKLLTTAVERFAGVEEKEHDKTKATHSNMSHQYDLKTLMGCKETNTSGTSAATGPTILCSPFMFPLSLDVYTHYDHKNSRAYLSWILNFAFGIYGQLRGLEEIIKERNCMRNASKSTSQCPSLPMCPGVLTALYQSGSSFMDQRQLAKENTSTVSATTTKKTCAHFRDVLSGLFNCRTATDPNGCTPLHNLIVQCEAFLWSIRLPFSLVQLSLWSVAILFISYVFVVPLDHFKIKSHLFNRLKYTMHPGLLIADQQRRVSEVAYFSL